MAQLTIKNQQPLNAAMTEKKKMVNIRTEIEDTLRAKFKAKCALEQRDMKEVIAELIEDYTNKK